MLSIQFHAQGREGQVGPPASVLLPPELRPLPLDAALDIVRLEADPDRQRDAAWTVLRGTPHPPFGARVSKYTLRYPQAMRFFFANLEHSFDLEHFDELRAQFRGEARLFGAALIAYSLGKTKAFEALQAVILEPPEAGIETSFAQAILSTGALGGGSIEDFLTFIGRLDESPRRRTVDAQRMSPRERCMQSLSSFEDEVGTSLDIYAGEFADTVAFMHLWHQERELDRDAVTVYPAFTVVAQDPRTLTTMVTATSLVKAKRLRQLTPGMDPRTWTSLSKTFRSVEYVDEGTLERKDLGIDFGTSHGPELLRENVLIHGRAGGTEIGYFDNLLWSTLTVKEVKRHPEKGWANLEFRLNRCVRSRFMWDERSGGLLIDAGWTKLRSIGPGLWRITARKALRFTDRTPQAGADGPLDFGQALNYLAPSTLSAWLEHDIYGSQHPGEAEANA